MEELLKKVSALNSEIAKLEKERLVAKTKKETIEKSLFDKIAKYKEKYDVDLSGKSVSEVEEAINNELSKVSKKCQEELDLKEKVVEAIKSGDVEKARKLLGIEEEKPAQPESRVNTTPVEESEETSEIEDEFDVSEMEFDDDDEEEEETSKVPFVEGKKAEEQEEKKEDLEDTSDPEFEDLSFEDDSDDDEEEEEEFLFSSSATAVSKGSAEYKQKLSSVEKSVEDVEKSSKESKKAESTAPKKPTSSFLFDDDDEGDSLGFKNLLNGSKFEI